MKVFLQILLYLICSDRRIEEGYSSYEQVPYVLLSTETGTIKSDVDHLVIKDLNDYTRFYQNYYGEHPGYVHFNFNENMMVAIFASNVTYGFDISEVFETDDQVAIRTRRLTQQDMAGYYGSWDPKNMLIMISMKRSEKTVAVYR